jgi:hypothetical protein
MKITITMYDDFRYNFTCENCYIDLRNHTFNIPGALGIDSIGFERLKHIEIKNVEENEMNNEEIEKLEWHISHNISYIEKQRMILEKLDKLFPNNVEDYLVDTNAGHCKLTYAEIFDIKTAVRCNMEECASWVECKTKKLEEMKNGKEKQKNR